MTQSSGNQPTPPLTAGSAVPAILREWLPQKFATDHPATIEALWAGFISARNGFSILFATLYSTYMTTPHATVDGFVQYVLANWFTLGFPAVFIAQRGAVAFAKAKGPSGS